MEFKNNTVKVAGAAIFSAISIVFAITLTPILPRLGWGIAIIDPVSIIWVLCFLIFGFTSGIVCSLIGFIALFTVDPFIPWGPMFKLLATLPLIITPYLLVKLKNNQYGNKHLGLEFNSLKKYSLMIIPAIIIRCGIMLVANLLFFIILIPTAIEVFGGILTISVFVIGINIEQSIWDLYIPWVISYPTKIYETYKLW
ncbi:MAG: hypothetical protein ACTSYR_02480 [Candidatus Odinarchaeia archaeon]